MIFLSIAQFLAESPSPDPASQPLDDEPSLLVNIGIWTLWIACYFLIFILTIFILIILTVYCKQNTILLDPQPFFDKDDKLIREP